MKNQEVKECWVPAKYIKTDGTVLDFTGLYEVSSLGKVRSLNYNHTCKVKELKQSKHNAKDGSIYYKVGLHLDNKQYVLIVHRIVLSSFKPEGWFPGADIDHVVERTEDSCIDTLTNLIWCTRSYNCSKEHFRDAQSKIHTNHPTLSKKVRVTNLTTGEITEYPSAYEVERSLKLRKDIVGCYIRNHRDYKKLNLHFEYIE